MEVEAFSDDDYDGPAEGRASGSPRYFMSRPFSPIQIQRSGSKARRPNVYTSVTTMCLKSRKSLPNADPNVAENT